MTRIGFFRILSWACSLSSLVVASAATYSPPLNVTSLDCRMRQLAYQYAQTLQPFRSASDMLSVWDALRLTDLCQISRPVAATKEGNTKANNFSVDACSKGINHCLYVNSSTTYNGDVQLANGSMKCPFSSIQAALEESRRLPGSATILLREGIHELSTTLRIGQVDAGLTLTGYPGEDVWISGGISLTSATWKPWSQNSNILVANLTSLLTQHPHSLPFIFSLFTYYPHTRLVRARYPNANPETDQWGYASFHNELHSLPSGAVEWQLPPRGPPPRFIYNDNLGKNDSSMPGYNLYASGEGGVCSSLWSSPSYWCSNASAGGWAEVDQECAVSGQLQIPAGFTYNATSDLGRRLSGWTAAGGIVHAWHSQSWSMHMFEIKVADKDEKIEFEPGGGRQGGRNWCRCDQCTYAAGWCRQHQNPDDKDKRLISGSWMVENILEELDQPGEFYLDRSSKLLYLLPNKTQTLENLRLALLETLIDIRDVANVTIQNIGFRDAAPTYLSEWGTPSGGDWALHRGGAVFVQNASSVTIQDCIFRRLDGNAVFLSRYTRHVHLRRNLFEWMGENAVATWGDTKDFNASDGDYPMYTRLEGNLMRELGIYQKQSSAYGHAKTAKTTLRNNIMFNMPRAAINFNDGMGGGDVVDHNLIFNTCRESGDHGPINTWDRQPFWTRLRDPQGSFRPLSRTIRSNFIFANYGASQAVDNDDGSSWYRIHGNLFYAAEGFKMDYGGHDSRFESNLVMSYPYDGQQCVNMGGDYVAGHGHVVRDNRCVVGLGGRNVGSGCGDPSCAGGTEDPDRLETVVTIYGCQDTHAVLIANRYFTPNGTALFRCGDEINSLEDFQNKYGLEFGSSYDQTPSEDTLLDWSSSMLFGKTKLPLWDISTTIA